MLFYLLLAVLTIIALVCIIMFAARKEQKLQHGKLVQICRGVTQTYKAIWLCPLLQALFTVGFTALQIYLLMLCYFSGSFDAEMSTFNFSQIDKWGKQTSNLIKQLWCALLYILLIHQLFTNYPFGMYLVSSVGCNWMNERVKASIGLQTLTGKLSLSQ